MKRNTLLIALGLVSSTALAQIIGAQVASPDSIEFESQSDSSMPAPASASDPQYESQTGTSQSGASSSQGDGASGTGSAKHPGASHTPSSAANESPERQAMIARLQPQTNDEGVSYICGGVGKEEASYMRKQANKHDLMLEFAARNGEFLSDVSVQIANAQGQQVLQTNCDGPMMLINFPKGGTYNVHADAAGYIQNQSVNVSGRGQGQVASVVLAWPQRVAQIPSSTETQSGGGQTGGGQSRGGSGENTQHGNW